MSLIVDSHTCPSPVMVSPASRTFRTPKRGSTRRVSWVEVASRSR